MGLAVFRNDDEGSRVACRVMMVFVFCQGCGGQRVKGWGVELDGVSYLSFGWAENVYGPRWNEWWAVGLFGGLGILGSDHGLFVYSFYKTTRT